MFIIVKLRPMCVEKIVSLIPEVKLQTVSSLQFIFFHPVAKPPERPLASIVANIHPGSKVSKVLTTVVLSPRVSCRRMTFSEH